ncbi:hypothetical protein D9758_006831 [Tetrapyrgos nigripes]|uniref:Uncharacterized protein n=1 Tax=Tetrapyrgos nigripes TaxID=182062 RepID=A0A8H5FTM2_9AGAR|nr:hypothetical protein D9758_006831 [Tetrapyrgos nigripes]
MSKSQKTKSNTNRGKKDAAVRQAAKKSKKTDSKATRFKNAQLKDALDSQAGLLYAINTSAHGRPTEETTSSVDPSVQDLTSSFVAFSSS